MTQPSPDAATLTRIGAVAADFALGAVRSVAGADGTNENYLIETDRGGFVVKFLRNADVDEIARGLPFLVRLEEARFRAVVPYLRTPGGGFFFRDEHGDAVVLRRVAGEAPVISPAVCRAVGENLARLLTRPSGILTQPGCRTGWSTAIWTRRTVCLTASGWWRSWIGRMLALGPCCWTSR